jgi:hypothetical protein
MAMGGRSRREAENAIGSCRPFRNSTGSMKGTRGSTRTLGWLSSHTEARRIRELLSRAVYVVWSYGTPIAFVSETEDGERTAYYVDESHSTTTANHQTIARVGMGEYETIGERRPARRPRRQPTRTVEGYGVVPRAARLDDASLVAAVGPAFPDRSLVGSPGYQNGLTESQQKRTLARLLDSRFSDPDWVPGRDPAADMAAECRDAERVEREGEWHL